MTKAKIGGFLEKYNEMYPLKSKIKKGKYPRLDTYHRQCKMCGYLTNKRSLDRHYKDYHPSHKPEEAPFNSEPTLGKYFWETKMSMFKDWEPLKFDKITIWRLMQLDLSSNLESEYRPYSG